MSKFLLSGKRRALLNRTRSSNRNTWRNDFFPPLPCHTKNSFCLSSRPCSFTLTFKMKQEQRVENKHFRFARYRLLHHLFQVLFLLTSQSRNESMASKSFPWRNWKRTISSAFWSSSMSSEISCKDGPSTLVTAFINCCSNRAYFPILCTGFRR